MNFIISIIWIMTKSPWFNQLSFSHFELHITSVKSLQGTYVMGITVRSLNSISHWDRLVLPFCFFDFFSLSFCFNTATIWQYCLTFILFSLYEVFISVGVIKSKLSLYLGSGVLVTPKKGLLSLNKSFVVRS